MDSRFELAIRKPTKLISLPHMHLIVGLEERGSFVRYTLTSAQFMTSFLRLLSRFMCGGGRLEIA